MPESVTGIEANPLKANEIGYPAFIENYIGSIIEHLPTTIIIVCAINQIVRHLKNNNFVSY